MAILEDRVSIRSLHARARQLVMNNEHAQKFIRSACEQVIGREGIIPGRKALSVRAPWWWFILHGKDIENRDWPTKFRGTVYVHASKWYSPQLVQAAIDATCEIIPFPNERSLALPESYIRPFGGCIVGMVDIVDCVTESKSPWFCGPYGFVLRNQVAFDRPIPCKGALGFFTPEVLRG